MRTHFVLLLVLAGCPSQRPSPPPATTALGNRSTASSKPVELAPFIHDAPAPMRGCKLEWDALMEAAEPRIELSATPSEDCAISADAEPPVFATMRGGVPARMMMEGPAGSGHFVSLDLAIGTDDHLRYGCLMGSTVGWRQMYEVGDQLAPLPWLEDVDRDGTAELVVWQRLPWGSSEVDNALFPVVYVLDGNALVRRDDRARSLFTRLAAAYRTRAKQAQPGDPTACFNAVAAFLETP